MKQLIIEDLALEDLQNTRKFFNQISAGWGDHLMVLIDRDLNKLPKLDILNHPIVCGFHRTFCKTAKQDIYYLKRDKKILIAAVLDQRHAPEKIKEILISRNSSSQ